MWTEQSALINCATRSAGGATIAGVWPWWYTFPANRKAICKAKKDRSFVSHQSVDPTQTKNHVHYSVKAKKKKLIITTYSLQQWIKGTLTLPGKNLQGVLPHVSWEFTLYGKRPQNNQHQAQTKLRLHNFLYYNRKTGLMREKQMENVLTICP